MILRPARAEEAATILRWRAETASWLQSCYGVDQWANPFPIDRILATIEAGNVWMVEDRGQPIATITVTDHEDDQRWTPEERAEPAHYVHKLNVTRRYVGQDIGSALLDWASQRAAKAGARWLRLDAWNTNPGLHRYYLDRGFTYLRMVSTPGTVSGTLFQRPAGVVLGRGPRIQPFVPKPHHPGSARDLAERPLAGTKANASEEASKLKSPGRSP